MIHREELLDKYKPMDIYQLVKAKVNLLAQKFEDRLDCYLDRKGLSGMVRHLTRN